MWPNPQETAEILNGKLDLLCNVIYVKLTYIQNIFKYEFVSLILERAQFRANIL